MTVTTITFVYGIIVDSKFIKKYFGWSCEEGEPCHLGHQDQPHDDQCFETLVEETIKWQNCGPEYLEAIEPFSAYAIPHDDCFEIYAQSMDRIAKETARQQGVGAPNYYVFGMKVMSVDVDRYSGQVPAIDFDLFEEAKNKFHAAVKDCSFAEAVEKLKTHRPQIIVVKNGCGCCS